MAQRVFGTLFDLSENYQFVQLTACWIADTKWLPNDVKLVEFIRMRKCYSVHEYLLIQCMQWKLIVFVLQLDLGHHPTVIQLLILLFLSI